MRYRVVLAARMPTSRNASLRNSMNMPATQSTSSGPRVCGIVGPRGAKKQPDVRIHHAEVRRVAAPEGSIVVRAESQRPLVGDDLGAEPLGERIPVRNVLRDDDREPRRVKLREVAQQLVDEPALRVADHRQRDGVRAHGLTCGRSGPRTARCRPRPGSRPTGPRSPAAARPPGFRADAWRRAVCRPTGSRRARAPRCPA